MFVIANGSALCFILQFFAWQEASTAAKLAFSSFKMKIRSTLAATHMGPDTLEEAVQDYINRNVDLYDLPGLVAVSLHKLQTLSHCVLFLCFRSEEI